MCALVCKCMVLTVRRYSDYILKKQIGFGGASVKEMAQ